MLANAQTFAESWHDDARQKWTPGGGARGGLISARARVCVCDRARCQVRQIRRRNNNYRRPLIIVALFATHLAERLSLARPAAARIHYL